MTVDINRRKKMEIQKERTGTRCPLAHDRSVHGFLKKEERKEQISKDQSYNSVFVITAFKKMYFLICRDIVFFFFKYLLTNIARCSASRSHCSRSFNF